jgi:hypothetical protein
LSRRNARQSSHPAASATMANAAMLCRAGVILRSESYLEVSWRRDAHVALYS